MNKPIVWERTITYKCQECGKILKRQFIYNANNFPKEINTALQLELQKIYVRTVIARDIQHFRNYGYCEQHELDPHIGCFSYPCCDLAPTGCFLQTPYDEVEQFGFKD